MEQKEIPAEDFKNYIGQVISLSDWFEIDQERVNKFADCTEDPQWIHIDVEKAKEGPFGGTISHGLLLLSLTPSFFSDNLKIMPAGISMFLNYGYDKVRFLAPVPVGARVRISSVLSEFSEKGPGRFLINVTQTIELEGSEKPACVAEFLSMFLK
jgi:acyl dehydratase